MAVAYKLLSPFESRMLIVKDDKLKDILFRFSENEDIILGFIELQDELQDWVGLQAGVNAEDLRGKFFFLLSLIDKKCVKFQYMNHNELYTKCFSMNNLLKDEIIILPRFESIPMRMIFKDMRVEAEKGGFYGRNYGRTVDVSGKINNFIILRVNNNARQIQPVINIPRYYKEFQRHLESNNYELRIGIFPLSNANLGHIFRIKEKVHGSWGLFSIESILDGQRETMFERCKNALLECKRNQADIAVFPEMLFTESIQSDIRSFVREQNGINGNFPRYIWLGTSWAENSNKCMVIDGYGNVVFEQKNISHTSIQK